MSTNYSEQPQPQQPQIYHPHYQMPLSESMGTIQEQTPPNSISEKNYDDDDDDDDSDELYDPEFGIGGNGRRCYQRRTKFSSDILSSGGGSARRRPTSVLSALSSGSSSSAAVISSVAVISAAAAAVSAGWSECEALAAATANPELLFSQVTFNPAPSSTPSRRRRIGSGLLFSSSFFDSARPLNRGNRAP
ncbi:hypothetical protein BGZ59_010334 [Podila verticillata]|nr:hypothetical protein BGZ59_010334 [Podila verticillata]